MSGFHVSIFQLILLMKIGFFFGSIWLLHCSWFYFSCKSFLLGVNKISCIHGSFLLSPTLPEVWNFHARPEDCVRYIFSFSLFRWFHKLWRVLFAYHLAFGLKTLTSKNAIWPACQNPRALISSLTSLPAAVECWRYSPVNYWSCGSTRTSLQSSFNRIDVIFLMCLCRKEAKPPFLQEWACWSSNLLPHSQLDGSLVSVQQYLIRIRSKNNCLV